MKKGGHFFVCGDVGMASDVTTTLSKIIQEHGKMTSEQAQSYLLKLRVKSSTEFKIKTLNLLIFFISPISLCDSLGNMILKIKISLICIVYVHYFIGIQSFP